MTARQPESTDEMLMVRYRRGDRSAFAAIVRRYERPLFTFALRYLKRRELARDVTQEAFLRVVKRAGEFRHEARFSTWIFSILRNLCIDELRKEKHRLHPSLDEAPQSGGPSLVERVVNTSTPDVERALSQSELRRQISQALDELPADQYEVFLLREIAGLPFAEIAKVTDTPENTVKSRMRYALERLQKALSGFEEQAKALR